jgi:hypothetical protein
VRGRNDLSAAVALALFLIVCTGVALAAPVAVLRLEGEAALLELPLAEGQPVRYAYVQSIYEAPTVETLAVRDGALRLVEVRTGDRRVIEYLRWPGEPEQDGDGFRQAAPEGRIRELRLQVTGAHQKLLVGGTEVLLESTFGRGVVVIRPSVSTRAAALAARWWQ